MSNRIQSLIGHRRDLRSIFLLHLVSTRVSSPMHLEFELILFYLIRQLCLVHLVISQKSSTINFGIP